MANGRTSGPNVQLARFVFDNTWSVDRLEAYATSYYPDGIPLRTLRHGLGHHRVPFHQYAQTLVKFATLLYAVGHVRTPAALLVEIILFRSITPLTQAEVSVIPEKRDKERERGEKKGGGGQFTSTPFHLFQLLVPSSILLMRSVPYFNICPV
jgi:hypothetical protein